MITHDGRRGILQSLADQSGPFATSIVVGVGDTPATVDDVDLDFAIAGADIEHIFVDFEQNEIYFKATLPASSGYVIHELGCYAINYQGAANSFESGHVMLMVFDGSSDWEEISGEFTLGPDQSRVSMNSIQYDIDNTSVIGRTDFIRDLSGLAANTEFDLAYYAEDLTEVGIRFKLDGDHYFEYADLDITNGYNISSAIKGSFTKIGDPDWSDIRELELFASSNQPTGFLSIDALRYSIPGVAGNLLARVVLDEPEVKVAGVSKDIEFKLDVAI